MSTKRSVIQSLLCSDQLIVELADPMIIVGA